VASIFILIIVMVICWRVYFTNVLFYAIILLGVGPSLSPVVHHDKESKVKTLRKTVEVGKKIVVWAVVAISLAAFMVLTYFAAGGPVIFAGNKTVCSGEEWVTVSDNDSPASLARRYFGDESLNHQAVTDEIEKLNGTVTFEGTSNAKKPRECHNLP
jgi:hypothetical protein